MVEVGAYLTRSDAELVQATLAAAAIPAVISVDDAGGARLLVDEADAQDAAAALAAASPRGDG
jgi:cell division protein FtsN